MRERERGAKPEPNRITWAGHSLVRESEIGHFRSALLTIKEHVGGLDITCATEKLIGRGMRSSNGGGGGGGGGGSGLRDRWRRAEGSVSRCRNPVSCKKKRPLAMSNARRIMRLVQPALEGVAQLAPHPGAESDPGTGP